MNIDFFNNNIKKNIKSFKFPKAIHLILSYLQTRYPNENTLKLYKRISFRSNSSLAFPKTEVHDVEFTLDRYEQIKVIVTINFLGLYGSSSPLPSNYAEMVLHASDEDQVLKDFLSMFNHNLQKFVFPIWEKNRYYAQYKKGLSDKFSKYVLSFLGLHAYSENYDASLKLEKLIPFIGLLSIKNKSARTLQIILSHYLSHKDIQIDQCIVSKYKIPQWQRPKLGDENCALGTNFLIGESIVSKNAKFRILLKNASVDDLNKYSVNGTKMKELQALILFVMSEPLEYEICFEIAKEKKTQANLSEENPSYMGVNFWLGESNEDETITMSQEVAS